jgi:hypothetical protein
LAISGDEKIYISACDAKRIKKSLNFPHSITKNGTTKRVDADSFKDAEETDSLLFHWILAMNSARRYL